MPPPNILIYRLGSLGDTVIALPCFHLIRKIYPESKITLLTNEPVSGKAAPAMAILENSGLCDEAVNYPVGTRNAHALAKVRQTIHQIHPDVLIHLAAGRGLFKSLRDLIFFRSCGIKNIVGAPLRRRDLQVQKTKAGAFEPESQRLASRLASLGGINLADPGVWKLELTSGERKQALTLLPAPQKSFIAVSVGTKISVKDWGEENWGKLLALLSGEMPGTTLILLGSADEWERSDKLGRLWSGGCLNLCGKISPRISAAILERCRLFIGHDSGPMHLAGAVGIPTLGLFSWINPPGQWFPGHRSWKFIKVLYPPLPAGGWRTGLQMKQGGAEGIGLLQPRDVFQSALELWRSSQTAIPVKSVKKMRLVLLTHPTVFAPVSMQRFAGMITRGMARRGHEVEVWTSDEKVGRLRIPSAFLRKWLGYFDQFLIYPRKLRRLVEQQPAGTVFVVADQALGIWVPCLTQRPHVIHCHDFLALKSALGEFSENPTAWTGQQYQRLIWKGFSRGNAFISVSHKTRDDLHRFLPGIPEVSEVVHNGLNHPFRPMESAERISLLKTTGLEIAEQGIILHIGGNQWYKNRKGVLEIYRAYAVACAKPLALWMAGGAPTEDLSSIAATIPGPGKVHFLPVLSNEQINAAYAHARVFLFPSLEEGFGWPIVEAMASGCPVITTNLAPMTEVGGDAAQFIPRMPAEGAERGLWAQSASGMLDEIIRLNGSQRAGLLERGRLNAARFDTDTALASYEEIYARALAV